MMINIFHTCCDFLQTQIGSGEQYLAWFEAECSDFARFNHASVRQAGSVKQIAIDVRLIAGNRHISGRISLSGDAAMDKATLKTLIDRLRNEISYLPEDPFLLYSTDAEKSESVRQGQLPTAEDAVAQITAAAGNLDFVGIHAAGPICRGFGSSFGSRRWHETQSFNVDFSLHLSGDKAVKSQYAGFAWNTDELVLAIDSARDRLVMLQHPARTLKPGKYRVYLAPAALTEITALLSWDGFGIKAQETRQSPFLRLIQGSASLSPQLTITENTANGIAPNFESQGFAKPPAVPLIVNGQMASALVSPRSAKEFGMPTTGANTDESPEALEIAAGNLPNSDVLRRLDTGIYINNLWYLSYSDRAAGRITGMTRFATFWVENGTILAPMNVMRFDESIYQMLGNNLEAITEEREYLIDPSSYGARSTLSERLPGMLINDFTLTL